MKKRHQQQPPIGSLDGQIAEHRASGLASPAGRDWDQLARNIASELAIGDDAQVLTIIKEGLNKAYRAWGSGSTRELAAAPRPELAPAPDISAVLDAKRREIEEQGICLWEYNTSREIWTQALTEEVHKFLVDHGISISGKCARETVELILAKGKWREAPPDLVPAMTHGIDCKKEPHVRDGYLHDENDDAPYDVDGCLYCGRCHLALKVQR